MPSHACAHSSTSKGKPLKMLRKPLQRRQYCGALLALSVLPLDPALAVAPQFVDEVANFILAQGVRQ